MVLLLKKEKGEEGEYGVGGREKWRRGRVEEGGRCVEGGGEGDSEGNFMFGCEWLGGVMCVCMGGSECVSVCGCVCVCVCVCVRAYVSADVRAPVCVCLRVCFFLI